jgi:hypothetical protein
MGAGIFMHALFLMANSLAQQQNAEQSVHLTLGILRHFQAFFYASAFFWLDGFAVPAPAQVPITCSVKSLGCNLGNQFLDDLSRLRGRPFFYFPPGFPFFRERFAVPELIFRNRGISASARCPILEVPPQMKTRTALKRRRSRFLGG